MILRRKYFLVSFLSQPWISARTILGSWRENGKKYCISYSEKQSAQSSCKIKQNKLGLFCNTWRNCHTWVTQKSKLSIWFSESSSVRDSWALCPIEIGHETVVSLQCQLTTILVSFQPRRVGTGLNLGFFGDRRLVFVVFWDRHVFFRHLVFLFSSTPQGLDGIINGYGLVERYISVSSVFAFI